MALRQPLVIVSGQVQQLQAGDSFPAPLTAVEVDLGSLPRRSGKFTITDAAISAASKVVVTQAGGAYTGKGAQTDEAEMGVVSCAALAGSGSATVYWTSPSFVKGNVKFFYLVGS